MYRLPLHLRQGLGSSKAWSGQRTQPQGPAAGFAFPMLEQCSSPLQIQPCAYYSDKRPSFFGNILKNIQEEYSKSSEMQENLKKFREEAKKLEESEALKAARKKFENIEGQAIKDKSQNVFKDHISGLADKVKGTLDEVSKAEAVQKASKMGEGIKDKAGSAAKNIGSAAEELGKSNVFKAASTGAQSIKDEIESNSLGQYSSTARTKGEANDVILTYVTFALVTNLAKFHLANSCHRSPTGPKNNVTI